MSEFKTHTRQEEREPLPIKPRPVYQVIAEVTSELARFNALLDKVQQQIEDLA